MIAVCVLEPEVDCGAAVVDMEDKQGDRIARLEANVEHIQSDVTDLKVELRRTNDRLDKMGTDFNAKIDVVSKDLTGVRLSLASLKVWAISMYTAQAAALLFVVAKGLKWL
jgi:hypothetical protein